MASFLSILWLLSPVLCCPLAYYDKRDHVTPTTRENRQLKGNRIIQRLSTASLISCSHICLKNPRCLSINYKQSTVQDGGLCELNNAGLSDDFNENSLVMAKGFIFSQIRCTKVDERTCPRMDSELKDFTLEFLTQGITDAAFAKGISKALTEFTACLWMNSKDNQSDGTLFSYAAQNSLNELLIYNYRDLTLYVGGVAAGTQLSVADGDWHHICVAWRSITGSWVFFIDGALEKSGTNLNTGHVIEKGGVIVLGQEQDIVGGGFVQEQSFVGKIANVNLWDWVLQEEEMAEMSKDCLLGEGNVLKWEQFRDDIRGGGKFEDEGDQVAGKDYYERVGIPEDTIVFFEPLAVQADSLT